MASKNQIGITIDKLTRSIENAITGDSFKTDVVTLLPKDKKCKKGSMAF